MNVFTALLEGILQGLTEFLPISSSGHLVLFQHFTGSSGSESLFFNLMLHLGTLAAIVAAYYEDLWLLVKEIGHTLKEIFSGKFSPHAETAERRFLYMLVFATIPLVLVVPIRGVVSDVTGDSSILLEGIFFLVTSALLFLATKVRRGKAGIGKMKVRHAITIGIAQSVATFPGISRSGATISTGLILGFDREQMVKFSFFMAIPAILGGAVFEIRDAATEGITVGVWPLFVGMLAAAVVGYLAIQLVRFLLARDKFRIFAWYTLVLGVVVIIIAIVEQATGSHLSFGAGGVDPASIANSVVSSVANSAA